MIVYCGSKRNISDALFYVYYVIFLKSMYNAIVYTISLLPLMMLHYVCIKCLITISHTQLCHVLYNHTQCCTVFASPLPRSLTSLYHVSIFFLMTTCGTGLCLPHLPDDYAWWYVVYPPPGLPDQASYYLRADSSPRERPVMLQYVSSPPWKPPLMHNHICLFCPMTTWYQCVSCGAFGDSVYHVSTISWPLVIFHTTYVSSLWLGRVLHYVCIIILLTMYDSTPCLPNLVLD